MKPPMLHTAYKITKSRNAYGDFTSSASTALVCHFRYIVEQVTGLNNTTQADAMAWFEPDSGIVRNDIILFDSEYWRVERVTKARKLRNPAVQFIKTELQRYGTIS